MYLHKDSELFYEVVSSTSQHFHLNTSIIEKDYYVTMILKLLAQKSNNCVFKGGTSLSKCFHVIDRFSEDIDITFTEHLGESRRKKLKYNILKPISEELNLPIRNWSSIESDKDYNCYIFSYKPLDKLVEKNLFPGIKLETALSSYSFPTEIREVDSYIRQFLEKDNKSLIQDFHLQPFTMHIQSLSRTFIDKVFALCDYYMLGKSERYSRHLYDLFKLYPLIVFDNTFKELVKEVRLHRASMKICPSAVETVNIPSLIHEFCSNNFYKKDYIEVTHYFINDCVSYQDTIHNIMKIADSNLF